MKKPSNLYYVLTCLFIFLLSITLVGCKNDKSDANLEKLASELRESIVPDIISIGGDIFDFALLTRGNSIVYSYKYKNQDKSET